MRKKPDQVVYNEKEKKYDAALKPYATGVGAPKITIPDTTLWKNKNIDSVNKQLNARYMELKAEFDSLIEQFEYNNLVYQARFNFEPLVGETYQLYRDKNGEPFLSLIKTNECNFDFVGSFRLNSDKMWERISGEKTP